jgi:hypothetical protein
MYVWNSVPQGMNLFVETAAVRYNARIVALPT